MDAIGSSTKLMWFFVFICAKVSSKSCQWQVLSVERLR